MNSGLSISGDQLLKLVYESAINKQEKRSALAVASQILIHCGSDDPPINKALIKAASQIKSPQKRGEFVSRVIARLNRLGGVTYSLPKRRIPKESSALVSADFRQGNWGVLVPTLLLLIEPGPLRLALQMAYAMGFGKRAIGAMLLVGPRSLRADGAFCVPIAKFDSNHHHIIWLPSDLEKDVAKSLAATDSFENQRQLNNALQRELTKLRAAFARRKPLSPKDRSPFARSLRKSGLGDNADISGLTVARLLEAARGHGAAKGFPGYLRDMLTQSVLPASVERIGLRTMAARAAPASPNFGVKNEQAVEKLMGDGRYKQDADFIELLSNFDGLPDALWTQWQTTSLDWVQKIVHIGAKQTKARREWTLRCIKSGEGTGRNSWFAWALAFMHDKGGANNWTESTWRQYRSVLFSPEVSAFSSTIDVEEFDDEDLALLIGQLEARKNSPQTLKNKVSLIVRMIKFAQASQPNYAFPQVQSITDDQNPQLNKRAHILSPAEIEVLIEQACRAGHNDEALVLALVGFLGMRPIEIMYLRDDDLTLLPGALEINIERSKTPAGKRCLPVGLIAPMAIHDFLLEELGKRKGKIDGADLFFGVTTPKTIRRMHLMEPALGVLRAAYGLGIDLYTLRHSFASWSFVRMGMLANDKTNLLQESPNLKHEIFRSGLADFGDLIYQQKPYALDPNSFYRLARLMGHATPETLPRTYLHTCGLVHSYYLARLSEF